jgi:hypothetical protein
MAGGVRPRPCLFVINERLVSKGPEDEQSSRPGETVEEDDAAVESPKDRESPAEALVDQVVLGHGVGFAPTAWGFPNADGSGALSIHRRC